MQRSVSSDQFEGKSAVATAAMAKDPATNVDRFAVQEHAAYSLVFVARAAIVAVSTLGDGQKQLNRVWDFTSIGCLGDSCLREQRLYRGNDR